MGNRAAAEKVILTNIQKIIPGDKTNVDIYKRLFASMNDKEFEQFMLDLKSGVKALAFIRPNFSKYDIDIKRNIEIAKEFGHSFFQRIWIEGTGDRPTYLTPIPYMVVKLQLRRQAQLLEKKISIPAHNNTVDELTGQPTGPSKGAKISYPETQVFASMGLYNTLSEFMKYRGGDLGGFDAMNKSISQTGTVSLKAIEPYASGVESTKSLKVFLTGMHLKSTL
jgi:hypothetical protein